MQRHRRQRAEVLVQGGAAEQELRGRPDAAERRADGGDDTLVGRVVAAAQERIEARRASDDTHEGEDQHVRACDIPRREDRSGVPRGAAVRRAPHLGRRHREKLRLPFESHNSDVKVKLWTN